MKLITSFIAAETKSPSDYLIPFVKNSNIMPAYSEMGAKVKQIIVFPNYPLIIDIWKNTTFANMCVEHETATLKPREMISRFTAMVLNLGSRHAKFHMDVDHNVTCTSIPRQRVGRQVPAKTDSW
jgi:hypothetical protein